MYVFKTKFSEVLCGDETGVMNAVDTAACKIHEGNQPKARILPPEFLDWDAELHSYLDNRGLFDIKSLFLPELLFADGRAESSFHPSSWLTVDRVRI